MRSAEVATPTTLAGDPVRGAANQDSDDRYHTGCTNTATTGTLAIANDFVD